MSLRSSRIYMRLRGAGFDVPLLFLLYALGWPALFAIFALFYQQKRWKQFRRAELEPELA